eukprot:TRINITY_DN5912_c0_g1_i1.p1 TRINITY_DN5912_c0_g1~~TRINITY_DN5912_c0_g1_i1.p1  ORF type:complete len:119 (-),score=13.16 TRINITY_DN5912_c0_g1_i1:171-527(-)
MAEREAVIAGCKIRVKYSELTREKEQLLIEQIVKMASRQLDEHKTVEDKRLATEAREYLNQTPEFLTINSFSWHVIVGEHFVCSLKNESNTLIFFDMVDFHKSVLAFKSGQRLSLIHI